MATSQPEQSSIAQPSQTNNSGHTSCENCGNAVSATFSRVYGDNDNRVWECPECSTEERLRAGHAGRRHTEVDD